MEDRGGASRSWFFTDRDRTMGLAVDEIVDTVEEVLDIELTSDRPA